MGFVLRRYIENRWGMHFSNHLIAWQILKGAKNETPNSEVLYLALVREEANFLDS